MLSENGLSKMNLLQNLIKQFWGNDVQISETKVQDTPFDMFEILILLYGRFKVLFEYDRSIIAISIQVNNAFENMRKLLRRRQSKDLRAQRKAVLYII